MNRGQSILEAIHQEDEKEFTQKKEIVDFFISQAVERLTKLNRIETILFPDSADAEPNSDLMDFAYRNAYLFNDYLKKDGFVMASRDGTRYIRVLTIRE